MEKYSFSKIHHFYDCPYSFYKRYFLEEKIKESHGTSEFGTFIHSILEKYEKNELKLDELAKYYEDNYESNVKSTFILKLSDSFSKDFGYEYYMSGLDYLLNFDGFKDWTILESEYEFEEIIQDKFIFTGKIDLIAEDKDKNIIICDHKSKKKFNSKKEKKEYAKQLYLYSYAVYKKYNKFPKKLVFNMFRNGTYEEIEFNKKDYNATLEWLESTVEEIETAFDFPAINNTFYCRNFCEYRNQNLLECKN